MNKVFRHQLSKGNGIINVHPSEVMAGTIIVVITGVVWILAHWSLAILFLITMSIILYGHRRINHGRKEHLALLSRRINPPVWNLCERDYRYRRRLDFLKKH